MAPKNLGGIPSANAKVFCFSYYTGEAAKSYQRMKTPVAKQPEAKLPSHCPPKTVIKCQETGGTVTHSL